MAEALQALKDHLQRVEITVDDDLNTGVDDVGTEALSKVVILPQSWRRKMPYQFSDKSSSGACCAAGNFLKL